MREPDKFLALGRKLADGFRLSLPRSGLLGYSGERLGTAAGSSLEFQDYRDYQPGDDLRRIDWPAFARTDRLSVRIYREEVQPKVTVLSDTTLSMSSPSENKRNAALALAGLIAESSFRSETSLSWWRFGNGFECLSRMSRDLPETAPEFGGGFTLEEEFRRKTPSLPKRGIRICISDFLWKTLPEPLIQRISDEAASVILIDVLCEEELSPPLYGNVSLTDSESGMKQDMQVGLNEKNSYLRNLESHLEMWRNAATAYKCIFCQVTAESLLEGNITPLVSNGILEPEA